MKQSDCIFCSIASDKILLKNNSAFVINDKFPHTKGHLLIIPFDHIENYFDLDINVRNDITELLFASKKYCDVNFYPSGYNVVVNAGKIAGQVIMHTHLHLIPRY
jgi:diadenosine tetraphosphate (Ap4A) HIT family hydrolase